MIDQHSLIATTESKPNTEELRPHEKEMKKKNA